MSIDRLPEGAVPLPPPPLAERHEINELMRVVRSYTCPIIFNTQNPQLGTAVLLRRGERLFAFTAAHNIAADTTIHIRLSPNAERTRFNILDSFTHPQYDPGPATSKFDLAILELESNTSVAAGDVAQLYTGSVEKLPEGSTPPPSTNSAFVWVVGYPAELARPNESRTTLYQTTFATQILDYAPDEMSLYYPETAYQLPHDGMTCEVGSTTPTPKGYSGGGVWATNIPTNGLFIPHRHIKLVGIQTHWSSSSRLIRCVPSKVMAEALKAFKPDLLES